VPIGCRFNLSTQRLLKFADEYCLAQNYNAIRLEALNRALNQKVIALYEKHGYDLKKIVYFFSRATSSHIFYVQKGANFSNLNFNF